MQFKDSGKMKAVTFSFDDGVTQDVRMIQLMDKYGLKATFHICSGRLGRPGISTYGGHKVSRYAIDTRHLIDTYAGHEVASHTIDHVLLPDQETDAQIIRQIEEDRVKLSELMGYDVVGFAFPGDPPGRHNYDERCLELIKKHTGVRYARTVGHAETLAMPQNLLTIQPTVGMCDFDEQNKLLDRLIESNPTEPQVILVMGHCYEMDYESDHWYKMEQFFERLSKRDDIFYGTNKEVYL